MLLIFGGLKCIVSGLSSRSGVMVQYTLGGESMAFSRCLIASNDMSE
jgi:hypothetical protein